MTTRESFRSEESYLAEHASRDAIAPWLRSLGWTVVEDARRGPEHSKWQVVTVSRENQNLTLRVRLCWRYSSRERHVAAQLANLNLAWHRGDYEPGDDAAVEMLTEQRRKWIRQGQTHELIIWVAEGQVADYICVPMADVPALWLEQSRAFAAAAANGRVPESMAAAALNGHSPTVHLSRPDLPELAQIARRYSVDLGPVTPAAGTDAVDDLPGAPVVRRRSSVVSYSRSTAIRAAVVARAAGTCECCGSQGFLRTDGSRYLETHHVIALADDGEDSLDNVVAVCPNCHREAHEGARAAAIEEQLQAFLRRVRAGR